MDVVDAAVCTMDASCDTYVRRGGHSEIGRGLQRKNGGSMVAVVGRVRIFRVVV